MGILPLLGVGAMGIVANPQLQYFENMPGRGIGQIGISYSFISFNAVVVPQSVSFNHVIVALSNSALAAALTQSISFGLYSLTGSTLTLLNSASGTASFGLNVTGQEWMDMATSATSNISPGQYYFALNASSVIGTASLMGNFSLNAGNAIPGQFLMGHMTASTNAMPASVATSDLDITGSDAIRQPYIIVTA